IRKVIVAVEQKYVLPDCCRLFIFTGSIFFKSVVHKTAVICWREYRKAALRVVKNEQVASNVVNANRSVEEACVVSTAAECVQKVALVVVSEDSSACSVKRNVHIVVQHGDVFEA